ncbi:MAG TPA: MBL fold metallo-hydrolase [Polyangiaceae bacterium]|jgi:phosphoribosyl 1,2-cyclic phosphodiesterase
MAFFVRFWGTRGSIPTPGYATRRYGGNTSCVEMRVDDTRFICDGGTGLRELGLQLLQSEARPADVHMLFSHMHWDHIQGFPFFLPAYETDMSLHVYEVAAGEDRIRRLLHGQMRSEYFPVTFSDLGARIVSGDLGDGETSVEGVKIRCFEQNHPGRSFAYSFEKDGKRVVYATDNEVDLTLENREQSMEKFSALRKIPPALVAFARGADLLIADGQYTDEEYAAKVGWGHARANTVVDLAVQAEVKQCAIFHHDPMHSDDDIDRIVEQARERAASFGSNATLFGAREGLELKIE